MKFRINYLALPHQIIENVSYWEVGPSGNLEIYAGEMDQPDYNNKIQLTISNGNWCSFERVE